MGRNAFGHQGFIAEAMDQRILIHFAARAMPMRRRMHACFIPEIEAGNYGSFLFRQFPQMLLLANRYIDPDCYVVPERTPVVMEAFGLLGFPRRPVFTVREVSGDIFDTMSMCTLHDLEGFVRPETTANIRRLALPAPACST